MTKYREIQSTIIPQWSTDGAGVRLQRSIASRSLDYLDPFLLFDHFASDDIDGKLPGFPMHPHRGIETVTYMLAGEVLHRDSMGNSGVIRSGEVQWMTAGRGIMHEEMPGIVDGRMEGFQLWVNLPASEKMMSPRYREITCEQIPILERSSSTRIHIIAGEVDGVRGPVKEVMVEPTYLDIEMQPGSVEQFVAPVDHTAFLYVFRGGARIEGQETVKSPRLLILGGGDMLRVEALNEPIARYGPFVMNTREEIRQALQDLRDGIFVR